MTPTASKDPVQKHIEAASLVIWLLLCTSGYFFLGTHFAFGVLVGGLVCMINYQWIYRNAKAAVTLTARQGRSFVSRRYFIRLAATGAFLYVLIVIVKVNIIGLLLGLSVVILGIVSYACFTYIFAGGD